jgi:hypothetical protein
MPQPGAVTDNGSLRAIVIRVAGAVATGIGVLGFVALVGGSDYWLRFSSAGLPADETVSDLSNSQLLVVGARELFPFLAIAVVEVVFLYLLEQGVRGTLRVGPLGRLAAFADSKEARLEVDPRGDLVTRVRVVLSLLAIPIGVGADALLADRITIPSLALVAAVAMVLSLIVLLYAGDSGASFTKFVLTALAASAVFGLFSGASRTAEAPDVRPVALVLDGKPLAGIFVAASADQVFIGEVCTHGRGSETGNGSTGSLLDLPRKDVSLMLIGNNARLREAITREHSLLDALPTLTTIKQTALDAVAPPLKSHVGGVACTGPSPALLQR